MELWCKGWKKVEYNLQKQWLEAEESAWASVFHIEKQGLAWSAMRNIQKG